MQINYSGFYEDFDSMNEEPAVLVSEINDDEIFTTQDSNGNVFQIKYIKSFSAKLSQANKDIKKYYNAIKNHALTYRKANSRISWHYDAIKVGSEPILKFAIRGKTLCIYYSLFEVDEKYKVERIESKKYEDSPFLYRIKNDRRCEYAKELVDIAMRRLHIPKVNDSNKDFSIPYEDTKTLISKGLIKEFKKKLK